MARSTSNNCFILGMAAGFMIGTAVAIISGTVFFHMHLDQMDEVRAEFHKHTQEAREIHSK
jgi:hypothetical protein